jgi:hypothetical protein
MGVSAAAVKKLLLRGGGDSTVIFFFLSLAGASFILFCVYMPVYSLPYIYHDEFLLAGKCIGHSDADLLSAAYDPDTRLLKDGRPILYFLFRYFQLFLSDTWCYAAARAAALFLAACTAAFLACFINRAAVCGKTAAFLLSVLIFTVPGFQLYFFEGAPFMPCVFFALAAVVGGAVYYHTEIPLLSRFTGDRRGSLFKDSLIKILLFALMMVSMLAYQTSAFLFMLPFVFCLIFGSGRCMRFNVLKTVEAGLFIALVIAASSVLYSRVILPELKKHIIHKIYDYMLSDGMLRGLLNPDRLRVVGGYFFNEIFLRSVKLWFFWLPRWSGFSSLVMLCVGLGIAVSVIPVFARLRTFRERCAFLFWDVFLRYSLVAGVFVVCSLPAAFIQTMPAARVYILPSIIVLMLLIFSLSKIGALLLGERRRARLLTLSAALCLAVGVCSAEFNILVSVVNSVIESASLRQLLLNGMARGADRFVYVGDSRRVSYLGHPSHWDEFNFVDTIPSQMFTFMTRGDLPRLYKMSGSLSVFAHSNPDDYNDWAEIYDKPGTVVFRQLYNHTKLIDSSLFTRLTRAAAPVSVAASSENPAFPARNIMSDQSGNCFWRSAENPALPQIINLSYPEPFYPESLTFFDHWPVKELLPGKFILQALRDDGKWVNLTVAGSLSLKEPARSAEKFYFGNSTVLSSKYNLLVTGLGNGQKAVCLGKVRLNPSPCPFFRGYPPAVFGPVREELFAVPQKLINESGFNPFTVKFALDSPGRVLFVSLKAPGSKYYPDRFSVYGEDKNDSSSRDSLLDVRRTNFLPPEFCGSYPVGNSEEKYNSLLVDFPGYYMPTGRYADRDSPVNNGAFKSDLYFTVYSSRSDESASPSPDSSAVTVFNGSGGSGKPLSALNGSGWELDFDGGKAVTVNFCFPEPVTVRSLSLKTPGESFSPENFELLIQDPGGSFVSLMKTDSACYCSANDFTNTWMTGNISPSKNYRIVFTDKTASKILLKKVEFDFLN